LSVLLDTHMWVWWLTPQSALTDSERESLDAEASRGELFLAAISLWEAQMLHAKGRLELPVSFADWLKRAAGPQTVSVIPLDVRVVLALDKVAPSFHGDPADRLIVATARTHGMELATRDANIRRSRLVKLWRR
jgi:PIN domain nuclease of toxin-antitoxin system